MAERDRCGTCRPPADGTADREALDRFAAFLRVVGDAPRDAEGRYLVNPRALEYAKGADVDPYGCTGLTARWCPRHGDCACPDDSPGERGLSAPGCPLHGHGSDHPWPDEDELPRGTGHLCAQPTRTVSDGASTTG